MEIKTKVIDVSEHNGVIDWEKVKPHIDGAILRVGYGIDIQKQDDKYFKRNADECTRLGIPFGVYIYSYADTVEKAKSEAAHILRLIKGYKLSYPVYYDLEEKGTEKGAVERANIFGDIIEKAGYMCGIYANLNWWNNYLKGLDRFTKWVAQYHRECTYKGSNLDMWQYSEKGEISGIRGYVDMNDCYRDFPSEISPGEQPKEDTDTTPEDDDAVTDETTAGFTDAAEHCDTAKIGVYKVTDCSGLHLRTGAGTKCESLAVLPAGTPVVCMGYYTGDWLRVETADSRVGFCHSDYLIKQ